MKVDLRVRGLLFDMDGVLMSSIGSVERSWQRYAVSRGLDPEHAIHLAHGRRAIETVRALRPDLDDATELRYIEDLEVEGITGRAARGFVGGGNLGHRTSGPEPHGTRRHQDSKALCYCGNGEARETSSRTVPVWRRAAGGPTRGLPGGGRRSCWSWIGESSRMSGAGGLDDLSPRNLDGRQLEDPDPGRDPRRSRFIGSHPPAI